MFFYRRWIAVVAVVASVLSFSVSDFSATAVSYTCTITGSSGSEILNGTSGNDVICTNGGNDVIVAGDGNDVILATGGGIVQVNAGAGNDIVDASLAASVSIIGGPGDDTITGSPGADTIDAGSGADTITAGAGDDSVTGSAGEILTVDLGDGADTFNGGSASAATVEGGLGNDTITGTANNDTLNGGGGNDTLTGLAGDDGVNAGAGDDVVEGGLGSDQLVAGEGADTLNGGDGNDRLEGDAGPDNLYGEAGVDTLLGNDGDDIIAGGDGVDSLDGGWGLNYCDYTSTEPRTATCIYDDNAPTLAASGMSSHSIDSTNSENTITVSLEIHDETGVEDVSVICMTDYPTNYTTGLFWLENLSSISPVVRDTNTEIRYPVLKTGSNTRLHLEFPITIPKGKSPGVYHCTTHVMDGVWNQTSYPIGDLAISRTGSQFDDVAPEVVSHSIENQTIDTTNGESEFKLKFTLKDQTAISQAWIYCTYYSIEDPNNGRSLGYADWYDFNSNDYISYADNRSRVQVSGTPDYLSFTITMKVRQGFAPGDFPCSLQFKDSLGHYGSLLDFGNIRVLRSGNYWDDSAPLVESFSLSPSLVDAGSGNAYTTVSITLSDTTGIDPYRSFSLSCWGNYSDQGIRAEVHSYDLSTVWSLGEELPRTTSGTPQRMTSTFQMKIPFGYLPGPRNCQIGVTDILGNSYGRKTLSNGSQLSSITVLRAPPGMPSAPAGLVYTPSDQRSGVLSWDAPSFMGDPVLRDYQIDSSRDGVSWTRINDGFSTTRSLPISNLSGGQTYFFRVRGENGGGDVAFSPGAQWSDVLEVRTPDPVVPSAPVGLSVSQVTAAGCALSWRAPSFDGGASITDFRVEVSSNGGVSWREVPHAALASTSFTVSGLSPGTSYRVRVAGVNAAGVGQFVTGALTTAARAADAPRNLRVSNVTASSLSLGWDLPVSNGGKPITDYKVEVSSNGLTWTSIPHSVSNSRTFNVSNLRAGTTYRFRVSAVTAVGAGSPSVSVSATTSLAAPGLPTGLQAVNTSVTQTVLKWTRPGLTGGASLSDYVVQYSTNDGQTWTAISHTASTSQSMTISGLQGVTSYKFRVAAKNSIGTGTFTDPITVTTAGILSSAPTSLVVGTITDSSVALSWSAPAAIAGMTLTDYKVEYSANNGSTWQTFTDTVSTTTSVTVTGLNVATTYKFRVSAINAQGVGAASTVVSARTTGSLTAPGVPQNFESPYGAGGDDVDAGGWFYTQFAGFRFDAPVSNGGSPITDYVVSFSTNGGQTWEEVSWGVDGTIAHDLAIKWYLDGWTPTDILVKLKAVNAVGSSPWTTPLIFESPLGNFIDLPGTPQSLIVGGWACELTCGMGVTFTPPLVRAGAPANNYELGYSEDGGMTWTYVSLTQGSPGTPTYWFTDAVLPGNINTLLVRVRALNINGIGNDSAIVDLR